MKLQSAGRRDVKLAPVTTNFQAELHYRKSLFAAVDKMSTSYQYWLATRFKPAVKLITEDAAPDAELFNELARLRKYWGTYFNTFADKLANQMARRWYDSNSRAWNGHLNDAGFDVSLQVTPAQRMILAATIQNNVSLIVSIAQQYHTAVEGAVTRSFLAGRDLFTMADELVKIGGITTRRAALIARDQSNKATATLNQSRQREMGIEWALWQHSSAGKEPRADHVKAGREKWFYRVDTGIDFGDGFGYVLPGEAINCRCTSRSVIPAMNRLPATGFDESKLVPVPGYSGAFKLVNSS